MSKLIKKSTIKRDQTDNLMSAILQLENKDEARRFFRDLLTAKEIEEFGRRWQVAKMLAAGIPYVKIEQVTGLSSTTVARVHKWLKHGRGGYRLILARSKK